MGVNLETGFNQLVSFFAQKVSAELPLGRDIYSMNPVNSHSMLKT